MRYGKNMVTFITLLVSYSPIKPSYARRPFPFAIFRFFCRPLTGDLLIGDLLTWGPYDCRPFDLGTF